MNVTLSTDITHVIYKYNIYYRLINLNERKRDAGIGHYSSIVLIVQT